MANLYRDGFQDAFKLAAHDCMDEIISAIHLNANDTALYHLTIVLKQLLRQLAYAGNQEAKDWPAKYLSTSAYSRIQSWL